MSTPTRRTLDDGRRLCDRCDKPYEPTSNVQKYCAACAKPRQLEHQRAYRARRAARLRSIKGAAAPATKPATPPVKAPPELPPPVSQPGLTDPPYLSDPSHVPTDLLHRLDTAFARFGAAFRDATAAHKAATQRAQRLLEILEAK